MSPWLPFGNQFGGEARTLLEYRQLEEERRIRLERRGLDEQLAKVERRRSGCAKATLDLQNAIRRDDWKAFPRLIDRAAVGSSTATGGAICRRSGGRLEFTIKLLPYDGDDGWIADTLTAIRNTLSAAAPPPNTGECEFCAFAQKAVNAGLPPA